MDRIKSTIDFGPDVNQLPVENWAQITQRVAKGGFMLSFPILNNKSLVNEPDICRCLHDDMPLHFLLYSNTDLPLLFIGAKLVVIDGLVHDVSEFILQHPGGAKVSSTCT